MRNLRLSAISALSLVVLTCAAWSPASAQTDGTVIVSIPFSGTTTGSVDSECLGEPIQVTVAFKGFVKVFTTPTAVNTLTHELSLASGISGTVVFQGIASSHDSTRTMGINDSYEDTFTTRTEGITQGSTPNVFLTLRTHVTIAPDGTTKSEFISTDTDCRPPQ